MSAAELNEQGVNGSNLHAATAAGVPDFCGLDVIFLVRLEEGQRGEAFHQLGSCLWPSEALQKLLENQAGREDLICPQKGMAQSFHLGRGLLGVSA